jgi:hypothetical protein
MLINDDNGWIDCYPQFFCIFSFDSDRRQVNMPSKFMRKVIPISLMYVILSRIIHYILKVITNHNNFLLYNHDLNNRVQDGNKNRVFDCSCKPYFNCNCLDSLLFSYSCLAF